MIRPRLWRSILVATVVLAGCGGSLSSPADLTASLPDELNGRPTKKETHVGEATAQAPNGPELYREAADRMGVEVIDMTIAQAWVEGLGVVAIRFGGADPAAIGPTFLDVLSKPDDVPSFRLADKNVQRIPETDVYLYTRGESMYLVFALDDANAAEILALLP